MRAGQRIRWLLLVLGACGTTPNGQAVADKPSKQGPPTLAARGGRSCQVLEGRPACWGSNVQGALRPDAPPSLRAPLYGPFDDHVRQVLPLEAATCVLTDEGTVRCVGVHPRSILVTDPLEGVTFLEGGRGYACAVHGQGRVSCWGVGAPGSRRRHELFEVEGLHDAVQLASGVGFMCALKQDRTVACWGDNRHGQLGDGSDRSHDTPGPIAYRGADVAEIAAGSFHACLRTTEGQVLCWGRDEMGQVDGGDEPHRLEPTPVPDLAESRAVAAGGNASCAITGEGVTCWGNGACGQRGVTPTRACAQRRADAGDRGPRVALEGDADALAMGQGHVCARRGDEVLCWGSDDEGQLGRGATEGMTRSGACHPRAGLCASEQPRPVLEAIDDPDALPLGEGIEWQPPMTFAAQPRPEPHDVTFEVLDPVGHDAERLSRLLSLTMRMPSLSCYRRLGPDAPPRVVEVTVQESGSEIPEVGAEDLNEALMRCFRSTMARGYYSIEGEGSFRIRASFTPDGWDGTI